MDDYEAFFRCGAVKRKFVSGGTTSGRVVTEYETPNYIEDKVPEKTRRYAEPFVRRLKDEIWNRFDVGGVQTGTRETSDIYEKYDFNRRMRAPKLPIEDHKDVILETVRKNTVVILRGPTGCGKTTKVPQYILDDHRQKGLYCNIAVAQPRRIAASSNAKRVCNERGWICGSIVGYQIGSDHRQNCSDDTRVLFCTTGVLVETIINGSAHNPLNRFTHIILDEVHERDKDMDFLMIAIYKYLNPKIRIILMSATIDVEKFARYYEIPCDNLLDGKSPIIELGFGSNYSVTKVFLDEIEEISNEERLNVPEITEQMYQTALKLIVFFERVDRNHSAAQGIDIETYERRPKPTVLIFLPGIFEIKQMYQRLENWCHINGETKILRIVMHSTADPVLSELAMQESDKNTRKVILATNIAESSITVPDVKYVIDFCLTRNLVVNPITNFPSLQLAWASRDNCEQRAGRTGRVTNGWCFRLVSRHFYYDEMRQSAKAELVTSPLENIILKTKQLNLGSPEEVLALALDKPYLDEIHNAVLRLKEMGAMLKTVKGQVKPRDGDITYIGEIMSSLPIDVKLSKLIALGYCFGVLEECIIIAAALNCSKNIFTSNKMMGVQAYAKLLEFADGSGSDLFAVLNVYKTFNRLRKQGQFGNIQNPREREAVRKAEKKWAEENFLEISSLRECNECVKELRIRINRMNLIDCSKMNVTWTRNEKYIVLKVVIAGAFYPNYFSRSTRSNRSLENETFKTLGGRDLGDTVYFSGFKKDDLPHIYIRKIKDILLQNNVISAKDYHNIIVSHDGVSERVFVSFRKSGKEDDIKKYGVACQPGFVLTEVYKAVKLRMLKLEHPIEILSNRNTALSYAHDNGLMYTRDDRVYTKDDSEYQNVCYPKKRDNKIKGYISHTANCGRFWFQPSKYLEKINEIFYELNNQNSDLEPYENTSDIVVGQILAAVFPSDSITPEYYRAKVMYIEQKKEKQECIFEVQFIDFGNTHKCVLNELRRLRGVSSRFLSEPPYCFQCSLALIQPSPVNCPDGVWKNEYNKMFVDKTDGIEFEAEIYSVINGVARVFLGPHQDTINKYLIENSVAANCEETYMSKFDHIERAIGCYEKNAPNYLTKEVIRYLQEQDIPVIKPPTYNDGRMHTIKIKGPFTPLEKSLYGLTNNSAGCPKIDHFSVNHVLLENEPNDMSEKYLVAVSINQHDEPSSLTVRNTTLMPNIRLFGPLMAAIFAPKMVLLRNKSETQYIKMLTGLGCDDNNVCLSPHTNMNFDLDVELKNTDIGTINSIRSAIDRLMSRKCYGKYPTEKVVNIIKSLQKDLISLLSSKRLLIADQYGTISWEPYKTTDLESYDKKPSERDKNRILPPHQCLRLKAPEFDYLVQMKNHHEELRQKKFAYNDDPTLRSQKCKICNVDIVEGIRLHLMSRQHKDGFQAIEDAIKNLEQRY